MPSSAAPGTALARRYRLLAALPRAGRPFLSPQQRHHAHAAGSAALALDARRPAAGRPLPWPRPVAPGRVPRLIDLLRRAFPPTAGSGSPSPWLLSMAAPAPDNETNLAGTEEPNLGGMVAAPAASPYPTDDEPAEDAPQLAQATQQPRGAPAPAAAAAQSKGSEAKTIAPRVVAIPQDDGSFEIRRDGTRSWRNNNPGNIAMGGIARAHGALGKDDKSKAIFPTEEMGRRAAMAVLQSPKYQAFTLDRAIEAWAPPSENDTPRYQGFVRSQTGLAGNTPLSSLTPQQMRRLYDAIVRYEGWGKGDTTIDRR